MAVLNTPPALPGAVRNSVPLVVDLDGTLLRTDSLIESIFVLLRRKPLSLFEIPLWLAKGAAYFKHRLSRLALPDIETLPYRGDLLSFLRQQKADGRYLVLATAADIALASEIARHIGVFDRVIASDGVVNLRGRRKSERLVAEFGLRAFDYVGSSRSDRPVWGAAHGALLVSPSPRLAREVAAVTPIERAFEEPRHVWADTLHALRVHHWVKSALVFLPLGTISGGLNLALLGRAFLAFLAFSLCASSVYVLNDLLDLPSDRRHPSNKDRKLASGQVSPAFALLLLPLLLCSSLFLGLLLSVGCMSVLLLYFAAMAAYSVGLKDVPILDVLILAGGYSMRVVAGALALNIPLSAWLLSFCGPLFFSLALIKRYAELAISDVLHGVEESRARGYRSADKTAIVAQGIASGYLSVAILALYTQTQIAARYPLRQGFAWTLCVLLFYWVSYLWLMAARGRIPHDPVPFVFKDRTSLLLVLGMGGAAALIL